jgi:hypothetical protein
LLIPILDFSYVSISESKNYNIWNNFSDVIAILNNPLPWERLRTGVRGPKVTAVKSAAAVACAREREREEEEPGVGFRYELVAPI